MSFAVSRHSTLQAIPFLRSVIGHLVAPLFCLTLAACGGGADQGKTISAAEATSAMSTAAAGAAANTFGTASPAMAGFTAAATRTSILEGVPAATAAASEGRKQALAVQPLGRSSARGARELFSSPRSQDNIDLNGDGKADLLWSGASGDTIAWVMNGKAVAGSAQLLRDANFKPLGTGDFNGDGRTDIVWYSAADRQTVIWLMNGGPLVVSCGIQHSQS